MGLPAVVVLVLAALFGAPQQPTAPSGDRLGLPDLLPGMGLGQVEVPSGGDSGLADAARRDPEGILERLLPLHRSSPQRPLNVLLLGIDRRTDEVARADAIVLVRILPESRRVRLLSIPRDLWVDIPGYGPERINAAFAYGDAADGPQAGAELMRRTIEQAFGVPIDHYLVSDFTCFAGAVDSVGGVTVDVPPTFAGPQVDQAVSFSPGRQHLRGVEAVAYVRVRKVDSDFARMKRQQQVIKALLDEARAPDGLLGLTRFVLGGCPGMAGDLPSAEGLRLILALKDAAEGTLDLQTIDQTMTHPFTTAAGAQVLEADWGRIRPVVARFSAL